MAANSQSDKEFLRQYKGADFYKRLKKKGNYNIPDGLKIIEPVFHNTKSKPNKHKQQNKIINSQNLKQISLDGIKTQDELLAQIFGKAIPKKFYLMLFGQPGIGKSTFAIILAKKLANLGLKVLFIALEESKLTLQDKFNRLKAFDSNIDIAFDLPELKTLKKYDIIVLDSLNESEWTVDKFKQIKDKCDCAMILIFQARKDGLFRGENTWAHQMDIVAKIIKPNELDINKNRFSVAKSVNF